VTVDSGTLAEIRRLVERRLSPEEFSALADAPILAEERERVLELIDWFCRRYPTPEARLAYVRRATRRWLATQGAAFQELRRIAAEHAKTVAPVENHLLKRLPQ